MVVLLLLLLSSFLRFLSSRQEREFRFRSVFKIKRIKRRNFFSTTNVRHEDASTSREREVEIYFRGFLFDVAREHRPRNVQRAVSGRAADSACIVLGTRKLFLLARGLYHTARKDHADSVRRRNTSGSGEAHELKASPVAQMFSTTHSSRDRRHVACVTPWTPSS